MNDRAERAAAPPSSLDRSSAGAVATAASNSCRTMPNENAASSSLARAYRTASPASAARARASASSAVFPIPAGSSITTSFPTPLWAPAITASTAASSCARSSRAGCSPRRGRAARGSADVFGSPAATTRNRRSGCSIPASRTSPASRNPIPPGRVGRENRMRRAGDEDLPAVCGAAHALAAMDGDPDVAVAAEDGLARVQPHSESPVASTSAPAPASTAPRSTARCRSSSGP